MIIQLVTDRSRLAPGQPPAVVLDCLVEQARQAVVAGLDLVQVREPDLDGGFLLQIVRALLETVRGSATRVVVNERLDVALAAGAHGVHLRADSMEAAAVRRLAPRGFLVGRSVHAAHEAQVAGPVDYLVAGTIWSTPSKPAGHPLLGVDGLARVVSGSAVPVLGIGGVNLERVPDLATAGAAGFAAIGAWTGSAGACRAIPLHDLARAYRAAGEAANMWGHLPTT